MDILGNHAHPVVQILFPNNDANVRSWFEEHEDALQHLPCSTIARLKYHSTTVVRVRRRLPPPSFLIQLEDVLPEGWHNILLEIVRSLYEFVLRRMEAVTGKW
jgi:hypothetical protein